MTKEIDFCNKLQTHLNLKVSAILQDCKYLVPSSLKDSFVKDDDFFSSRWNFRSQLNDSKMSPPEQGGRMNERVALVCIMRACRQLGRVCRRVKLVRATSQPTPTCVALRRAASISSCIIFGASPRCSSISIIAMLLKGLRQRQELSSANTRVSRPRPTARRRHTFAIR